MRTIEVFGITGQTQLRLQDTLDGAVLLFLEDFVAQRGVFERHLVGLEILGAQRIVVVQERHDIVHVAADVGLTHTHLYLHVEEVPEREHLYGSGVDAADREGPATTDRCYALTQGERLVKLKLRRLKDRFNQRSRRSHADRVYSGVYPSPIREI